MLLTTLLVLAAPLPALAISDQATTEPVSADPGPAALSVSASLDSCGGLSGRVVCKLDVSFNPLAEAESYAATITRADGSSIDYGDVGAGGTSIWVPYVGAGNYRVKITAYGPPPRTDDGDGRGPVIATAKSRRRPRAEFRQERKPKHKPKAEAAEAAAAVTTVTGRKDLIRPQNPDAAGTAHSEASVSPFAPNCEPPASAPGPDPPAPDPPDPPEEPPEDLDPNNPDDDADGIDDEQEQLLYEQELAEYEAAVAAQQSRPPPPTGC